MIFFLNLNGTCTRQDTDHIYQGSNNASTVIAITSISPDQSFVQVAYTLPNGLTVGYLPMAYKGAYKVDDSSTVQMHLWELDLPYNVTEIQGTVGVSFNVVNSITGANMTSYTNSFEVEYSALPIPPASATESELEQILNLLQAYAAVNPGIVEKLENFQIGTVTAQASETGSEPKVTAEIVNETSPNGYKLNMNFTLPRGEQGPTGEITGAVAGVKGNNETEYRQGLVNLSPENIGAPSTSGIYEDLVVGSATFLTRHPLTSADDLDNFKNEGYYVWSADQPKNSPCAYASMIIMWAYSDNYPKQIVFRQGSKTNSNGQYTSDEIWLRSYNRDDNFWTDWVLIPTLRYLTSNFSNRNLLANPTFEINQREQVRYTGSANYTVDRWKSISANNTVKVLAKGIRFTNGYSSNSYIKQILEEDFSGLTLTFSANVSAINAGSARMAMYYTTADKPNTWTLINSGLTIDNSGIHSLTVTVPKSATTISADLGGTGFADIEFLWAKLEISPFATKFEPPNIAEELEKCQRYFLNLTPKNWYRRIALGYFATATRVRYILPFPVYMRTEPTVTIGSNLVDFGTSGALTYATSVATNFNVLLEFDCAKSASVNAPSILYNENTTKIWLDAEL